MAGSGQDVRRRRRRERQAVVFGSLLAGMSITALVAAAVYTDVLDVPFLARDFTSPEPTPEAIRPDPPCPSDGALPVAYESIEVQVLNSTDRRGLAGTSGQSLAARGFVVTGTGNAPGGAYPGTAQIVFGAASVDAAYTLAAHVPDPELVLDRREDATIDVVLGETYQQLAQPETVTLDPAVPLEGVAGCVPLEQALQTARPEPTAPADEAPADDAPADEAPEGEAPADGEG